jgi:acetamidase/formamidase
VINIEGATTNDILVVKIHRVRPNHDIAAAQFYSGFGGPSTESRVRMLNDPITPRRYSWRLDRERNTATTQLPDSRMKQITIDLQPMLGRVAVAPAGAEAFAGIWPGDFATLEIDLIKGKKIDWPLCSVVAKFPKRFLPKQ